MLFRSPKLMQRTYSDIMNKSEIFKGLSTDSSKFIFESCFLLSTYVGNKDVRRFGLFFNQQKRGYVLPGGYVKLSHENRVSCLARCTYEDLGVSHTAKDDEFHTIDMTQKQYILHYCVTSRNFKNLEYRTYSSCRTTDVHQWAKVIIDHYLSVINEKVSLQDDSVVIKRNISEIHKIIEDKNKEISNATVELKTCQDIQALIRSMNAEYEANQKRIIDTIFAMRQLGNIDDNQCYFLLAKVFQNEKLGCFK